MTPATPLSASIFVVVVGVFMGLVVDMQASPDGRADQTAATVPHAPSVNWRYVWCAGIRDGTGRGDGAWRAHHGIP